MLDDALPLSPGSVICARPSNEPTKSLFIRCEDGGVISVRDIKPEGKPILDARSFWNGVQGKHKEVRFVGV
jgi:methionyl-tRNA formyltransferase